MAPDDEGRRLRFETTPLPPEPHTVAPDGSAVRILGRVAGGSAAHFELGPGHTSVAVRHRSVEEIWYVVGGAGEMWRRDGGGEETVVLEPGTCVTIPIGTAFQFRCTSADPLGAVGVTMPPWPGDGEAVRVDGPWAPTVAPGPGLIL
jgi:mannose-6-phosphate isomerase-like protein (cupin superfamily)